MEVNTNNGDKTYVYGDLYQYNIEKNEWKPVTSPNSPPGGCVEKLALHYWYDDLWRLDSNTNVWEQLQLKGCPGARFGHRLVLYKHKLILFGRFYDTLREIFFYGGYFKQPASDKDQSDKAVVLADMWTLDPRIGSGTSFLLCFVKVKESGKSRIFVHKRRAILFGGVVDTDDYGLNACVGKTNVFCRYPLELRKPKSLKIKETQSQWIEASEEEGESDYDNSDAGSIKNGTEDDCEDATESSQLVEEQLLFLRGEGKRLTMKRSKIDQIRAELGLADFQRTPLMSDDTWRNAERFFLSDDHVLANGTLRSSGRMDLTWQRHADKLARLRRGGYQTFQRAQQKEAIRSGDL
ncbi:hypothetical protein SELMODRAFT_419594 [Selaginella moellendorffii]|uniref:Uncharacterized protein n=1 Tax=Selaginella moellendorffii TaxID=88036 RepID=D8S9F6_SELML|nr:hypothetical protein SELMODRAFT_419594 [Selaginella moellendorffii]